METSATNEMAPTPETNDDGNLSAADARSVGTRVICPAPFVRQLRYHLDSCAGTNKRQYFLGGVGLLLATGVLDAAHILYMVVGHTKFSPDLVARAIAGRYNCEDTFNHAMLNKHIQPFGTVFAYDGELLETWKQGSCKVFKADNDIMSYRSFIMVADDRKINVGDPVTLPNGMEQFPSKGPLYSTEKVKEASRSVAERILREDVMPGILAGTYRGIADDSVCMEQVGWMMTRSVEDVNEALAAVEPYEKHHELRKEPYGSKKKQIEEQYTRYVPVRFVPDFFELRAQGASGLRRLIQSTIGPVQSSTTPNVVTTTLGDASSQEEQPGGVSVPRIAAIGDSGHNGGGARTESARLPLSRKRRRRKKVYASVLTRILVYNFVGKVPRVRKELERLVSLMPADGDVEEDWDSSTLKRHASRLVSKGATSHR